ncbi:FAD-binding domain-containing protein [Synechococcus sp. BA-124 BA4]|uniref:cryptochrome/deoxyribodipyrimidine photo-lyase family protein n=1 Tax=unclassified Synechococcus TaxID=2626047 RepID=UPI002AD4737C|nr:MULTISPECIES: FAD-binding domain-containing protein [unclassified Synechococcus]MEA5398728.1 FAD-binding domain-containing protein [Synechococcus sp. BA-124 BA4]CAK6696143.1 Cryptochrome-like protein cry2 [Synechococcus sp. CBW1107]
MGPVQVVWFKRDLRAADHQPLVQASCRGPVLPLVVVEPDLWRQSDVSARQWAFCAESLEDLRRVLSGLGQPLVLRIGTVEEVLEQIRRRFGIAGLWSHEETGNGWTYARDRRVARWARIHSIPWIEIPTFGVIRRLDNRNGWARRWEARMAEPVAPPPDAMQPLHGLDPGAIPSASDLGLTADPCPGRQIGGRAAGLAVLESFLNGRGARYHRELSSPLTAFESCSRLSPHFAWGTLSMREVVQRSRRSGAAPMGFEARLHWHCHFIQKLESQPDLEFRELHPLTAGLRISDPGRLAAWAEGRTGLPFVDACMRALIATGWINFRMRAMLMSVASYHLWLPWRESGLHLARLFVDYEPGIHWSQCQMQSGTTGINTIRIYNPVKQGQDHDPRGAFIRQWLPELAGVPAVHLHEPWTMAVVTQQRVGCVLGVHYPVPIVKTDDAAREARARIWAARQERGFAELADAIQHRHGSRRSGLTSTRDSRHRRSSPRPPTGQQIQLPLDLDLA